MVFLLTGEGREDVPILFMSGDAHIQNMEHQSVVDTTALENTR